MAAEGAICGLAHGGRREAAAEEPLPLSWAWCVSRACLSRRRLGRRQQFARAVVTNDYSIEPHSARWVVRKEIKWIPQQVAMALSLRGSEIPHQGSNPRSPALRAWRLNHWTTREVPC
ncbi:unnamed protein product [Rangifer tarandus platyrhynchus]|uniref:Uncharacterized protein n=1 Tax=Rangifer tarandus platyrhynchus TaxID=3082113 RepID=A0AC59ZHW5_RANTA